jgi:hypothetical protein
MNIFVVMCDLPMQCTPNLVIKSLPIYEQELDNYRREWGGSKIPWPNTVKIAIRVAQENELVHGLKLDILPQWDKPAQKGPPGADDRHSASTDGSVSPPLRTIKIFLASSSELKEDRDGFDLHFRQVNDRLLKKGIYLQILRWENFLDAMSETCLQEEYNKEVRNCDIFLSLFKTKTGKYTEGEFDAAHRAFKDSGKPLIYAYFMRTITPNDKRLREDLISLWNFQDKLSGLGHYHTHYKGIEDLKLQFQIQLDKLIEEGKL